MNPITYIKMRVSEWWYDWFERQSKYVWDRSAERREQQKKEEQAELARSITNLSLGSSQHYTNTIIGNGTTLSANTIAPLTVSQIGQITNLSPYTYNPTPIQGALKLNEDQQSQPIQFTIHNATGGKVVEYIVNDGNTRKTKLHIITSDKDLGHELGKIITLELLRN